jgi:RNA:NAD 2'-phosphotransferase (TPT1/KptA family)
MYPKTSWRNRTNSPKRAFRNFGSNKNPSELSLANLRVSDRNNRSQITSTPEIPAANTDDHLSQSLVKALKKPKELGLTLANGFLNVTDILQHPTMVSMKYTFQDVERVILKQAETVFEWFELLKIDDQTWNIRLVTSMMRKALFETLDQAEKLNLFKKQKSFINCNDLLQIPAIKEAQIELQDIEKLLSIYGRYNFVRYESGLCLIRSNAQDESADQWMSDRDYAILKDFRYQLRHKTTWTQMQMSADGFVEVNLLLNVFKQMKKQHCNIDDIKRILSLEEYPRFALIEYNPGRFKIKANHGHSIQRINAWNWAHWKLETKMQVLAYRCNYPQWTKLRKNGWKKDRNTFNFIDPNDKVTKITREIEISIDAVAAREDGIKFFVVPENDLIVTEGLKGRFPLKYFIKAVDRASGEIIKVSWSFVIWKL